MGTDDRFKKNHCFYLSFFPKSRTNCSFKWKTNFNKNSLILLMEQIFLLVEISFANRFLSCVATVIVPCRNRLPMQNFIPANVN